MTASPLRLIVACVATLMAAAWWSPCCCQSAWVAEGAAQLVRGGASDAGCPCCQERRGEHKERCPLGGEGCTREGGSLTSVSAEVQPAPAAGGWVELLARGVAGENCQAPSQVEWGEGEAAASGGAETLLGLGCALVI